MGSLYFDRVRRLKQLIAKTYKREEWLDNLQIRYIAEKKHAHNINDYDQMMATARLIELVKDFTIIVHKSRKYYREQMQCLIA